MQKELQTVQQAHALCGYILAACEADKARLAEELEVQRLASAPVFSTTT